jgi:hypothetical protein
MRFVIPALFVTGVVLGAGAWGYAQVVTPDPVMPVVISGSDIGFRMEARKGDKAVGRLVVRVDGTWMETESWSGVILIKK